VDRPQDGEAKAMMQHYIVAGKLFGVNNGRVAETPKQIRHMRGWREDRFRNFCRIQRLSRYRVLLPNPEDVQAALAQMEDEDE
jgi:hypothetical protein